MSSTTNKETRSSHSSNYTNIPAGEKPRERRSTDRTEARTTGFDVHRIYDRFAGALLEADNIKSAIGTQDYIDGYRELLK